KGRNTNSTNQSRIFFVLFVLVLRFLCSQSPNLTSLVFEGSEAMPKEKVLVVDDDSAIRYTLTEALPASAYEPFEASTLAAPLDAFDAERPSAGLQDVNLPDGSGLDD